MSFRFQYKLSLSEDKGDVADAKQVQTAIKQIESGAMTLRGCLQHELTVAPLDPSASGCPRSLDHPTPLQQAGSAPGDYQAVELGNPSDRQRARIRGILRCVMKSLICPRKDFSSHLVRFYYKKFDADNSGVLDVVELSKIFVSMGENVAQAKLDELFK